MYLAVVRLEGCEGNTVRGMVRTLMRVLEQLPSRSDAMSRDIKWPPSLIAQ